MITTTVCDDGSHGECPGRGLTQGILREFHEPDAVGHKVWVTVSCECPCHTGDTDNTKRGGMKVRDLQAALGLWRPNTEFEVAIQNNPDFDGTDTRISTEPERVVVLIQGSNTIRLN